MAISGAVVFEVRNAADFAGASDGNGGGFRAGAAGTDYSHADIAANGGPHVTIDGATITATVNATTTKLDISGYTTAAGDVGNLVNITGGSMTAGLYEITGQTGGTQWTLDRACGTAGQTGTGAMGGCFATPGKAAAAATVDGHLIWVRYSSTPYTITTATPGAAGPVLFASAIKVKLEGYQTTRGDLAARPVLSAGSVAGTYYLFAGQGNDGQIFANVGADGEATAGVNASGFNVGNLRWLAYSCTAVDCNQAGCVGFNVGSGDVTSCSAANCATGFDAIAGSVSSCVAMSCGVGFSVTGSECTVSECIAHANSSDGFASTGTVSPIFSQCTSDDNGGDGFDCASYTICQNCVATDNGGYGFNTIANNRLLNCAAGVGSAGNDNTSGAINATPHLHVGQVTITANPYADGPNDDFRPNNTAGGGALLRSLGIGPYGQTNNTDIGAVQHSDPVVPAVANVRYGITFGDASSLTGLIEMPNSDSPTGTQDETSDACVVSGKKYGSPQRTGSAAGGGYTYGDNSADKVLTTATGAGNYLPIADSDTVDDGVFYGAGEEGTGLNAATLLAALGMDAGNLDDQLAAIKARTDLITTGQITIVSPVSPEGTLLTIVRGDDCTIAAGQAIEFTFSGCPDLTGAAVTLTIRHPATKAVELAKAGTVIVAGAGPQTVRFEPTAAETNELTVGVEVLRFDVQATLASGAIRTPVRGNVTVLADQTR
jgi:hypothetical protein